MILFILKHVPLALSNQSSEIVNLAWTCLVPFFLGMLQTLGPHFKPKLHLLVAFSFLNLSNDSTDTSTPPSKQRE